MKQKFYAIPVILAACAAVSSCMQEARREILRDDYITVYEQNPQRTVDNIQVPFDGAADAKINILYSQPLDWVYRVNPDQEDPLWFQIKDVRNLGDGHMEITYDAASILELNTLERRQGYLSFSSENSFLGKFLTIRQGYTLQYEEDFGFLGGELLLSGKQTYTTEELAVINKDLYDYVSFNAYAEVNTEFLDNNITLDVTIKGGKFDAIDRTTYRVSVPLGDKAQKENLHFMLLSNGGELMSPKTTLTFSVANDEGVTVHIDNLNLYKVSEAELHDLSDEEFDDSEEWI